MGLQKVASFFAMGCYYMVGVPMGCYFAYKHEMGVVGRQIGIAMAFFSQFVVYLIILLKKDWQQVADEAAERIQREARELEQLKAEMGGKVDDDYAKIN